MITAVVLNPCIDRAVKVERLNIGGLNRILSSDDTPSGKGVNVAKTLSLFKVRAAVSGIIFEDGGSLTIRELERLGIRAEFFSLPGRMRVNTKVLDLSTSTVTELNEPGQQVNPEVLAVLRENVLRLSAESEFIVFTGSAAPGLPGGVYRDLIGLVKKTGCKAVLDADGALFKKGMEAVPYVIKPNLFELEQFAGKKLNSLPLIKKAAEEIIEKGVSIVLVSLGADGALLADRDHAYYSPGLKINVVNTVGAGDAMLAGALYALLNKKSSDEVLKFAAAAAAASVSQEGTGLSDASVIPKFYDTIEVREI
jgi:1-phosphofructokinase